MPGKLVSKMSKRECFILNEIDTIKIASQNLHEKKIPTAENGMINFNVLRSNSFLNLSTTIKSEGISTGKITAKAWFKGMTTGINGIEIRAIDPHPILTWQY